MNNKYIKLGIILTTAFLSACGSLIDDEYKEPVVKQPDVWMYNTSDPISPSSFTKENSFSWWKNFNRFQLNQMVEQALRENNDLAAATIRVRKAQLSAGLAEDDFLPDLSVTGSASKERNFYGEKKINDRFSSSASVQYELDLWGKLGSNYDAAKWEALATLEDRESTALSLVGTVSELYWQLIYNEQRRLMSLDSIAYTEKSLELVKARYNSGAISSLEVLEAERNIESQKSSYTQIVQSLRETKTALSILFNRPPGDIEISENYFSDFDLPIINAGLPSSLLERRPDVKAAELRLREKLEKINVARANFFPTLSLTGSFGSSSNELRNLLSNPVGTIGANLALPFLNWNERDLNLKISKADYEEAIIEYRQTVYQAFADVENLLSQRIQYEEQYKSLKKSLTASEDVEKIYEARFKAGSVEMQVWLDAQENRRRAEEALLENNFNRFKNIVNIYQALGGDIDSFS